MKICPVYVVLVHALIILFIFYSPLLSQKNNPAGSDTEKDTFIINEVPGAGGTLNDALVSYINYKEINEWAETLKMSAIEDSPPVIDGTAFFIIKPHIEIPVIGLKKGERYYLYIDFVKYRGNRIAVNSFLKLFIKDNFGNKQFVTSVEYPELFKEGIFRTEIPFNLSYSGSFTIIIQEFSCKSGSWGIWDIIISSKDIEEIERTSPDIKPEIKNTGPKIFK